MCELPHADRPLLAHVKSCDVQSKFENAVGSIENFWQERDLDFYNDDAGEELHQSQGDHKESHII